MSNEKKEQKEKKSTTIYESDYDVLNSIYSDAPYSKLPSTVENNNFGTSLANPDVED